MEGVHEVIDQTQYLTFYLAGEEYAIGICQVKEIIEYDTITKVPGTPVSVRGVINLRGSVVPVLDLAMKFGLPESPITKRTCIVIVEVEMDGEQMVMGVVVDAMGQALELLPQDIEKPPTFGTRVRMDYLQGLGRVGKRFIPIFDINRVLSSTELLAVASVQESAPEAGVLSGSDGERPPGKEVSVP